MSFLNTASTSQQQSSPDHPKSEQSTPQQKPRYIAHGLTPFSVPSIVPTPPKSPPSPPYQDETASAWENVTIYHVPRTLRENDEKAYVPQLVSIGPFHRGNGSLLEMERHKWRSLHQMLRRTNHNLHFYRDSIRSLEGRARECYEEDQVILSSDEFVECMLLDACFILELFLGVQKEDFTTLGYSASDPIFAIHGSIHVIQRDMIMLENQIPLFILEHILALQPNSAENQNQCLIRLIRLIRRFFETLMPTAKTSPDPLPQDGLHCLDVLHKILLFNTENVTVPPRKKLMPDRHQFVKCVTDLREFGIKFKKHDTDRFWDIKFENGVLYIPHLTIHDGTKSLFLNLIALEQCQLKMSDYINITTYVIFMDNIINSGEDVKHLLNKDIIENWLGNEQEVADLFNNLCKEIVFDRNNSYLSELSEKVKKHCEVRWNKGNKNFKHRFLKTLWTLISLIAGVLLLGFTIVGTIYGVLGFYIPQN